MGRLYGAARIPNTGRHIHPLFARTDAPFQAIRLYANALFDLLPRWMGHSRDLRDHPSRPTGLPRMHQAKPGPCPVSFRTDSGARASEHDHRNHPLAASDSAAAVANHAGKARVLARPVRSWRATIPKFDSLDGPTQRPDCSSLQPCRIPRRIRAYSAGALRASLPQ